MFEKAKRFWKPPFIYSGEGGFITDKDGKCIMEVRGWGHLTGHGAHGLKYDNAAPIQDQVGEHVAALLTANWPK